MANVIHDQIETLIADIDQGLLAIYEASISQSAYQYIDFQSKLKRLLNLFADTTDNYRRNSILNYYYVFKDLYSDAGSTSLELLEIKKDENKLIWKVYQSRPGEMLKIETNEVEMKEYQKLEVERGNLNVGRSYGCPISKIRCLLDHSQKEYTKDEFFMPEFVNKDLAEIYRSFGFNEVREVLHGTGRFDSYIREILNDTNYKSEATHREFVIAHEYKVKVREADPLIRKEMLKDGGPKRYQAWLELNPMKREKYKPARLDELEKVVDLLADFPNAQKCVINDLEKMRNKL